jgi:hypothetical protein
LDELINLLQESVAAWQNAKDLGMSEIAADTSGRFDADARSKAEKYTVFVEHDVDPDLTQFSISFRPHHAATTMLPTGVFEGLGQNELKYMQSVGWELRTTLYGDYAYRTIACPEGYNCLFYAAALAQGIPYEAIYRIYRNMLPITNENMPSFCAANRVGFNYYIFGLDADNKPCIRLQKAAIGGYNKVFDVTVKPDPKTGINHIELLIETGGIKVTQEMLEDSRHTMPNCIKIIRAQESEYSAPVFICFDTETVWLYETGCIVPYGAQLFMRNPDDVQGLKEYSFMVEGPNGSKIEKKVFANKRVLLTAPDPIKDNHLAYDDTSDYMKCCGDNIIKKAFAEIRLFCHECEEWRQRSLKYLRTSVCPCRMLPYQPIVMTWNGARFDNQIFIQYALTDLEPTECLYSITSFVAARDILRLKVDNITFVDVCKLFPGRLAQVAADFGLPVQKGDMDHLNVQKMYEDDYRNVGGMNNRMADFLASERYRSYAFRDVVLVYQIYQKLDAMLRPLQTLKTKHYDIWEFPRSKSRSVQLQLDDIAKRRKILAQEAKLLKSKKEALDKLESLDPTAQCEIRLQASSLKIMRANLAAEKADVDTIAATTSHETKIVKMLRRMLKTNRACPSCAIAGIERHGSYLKVQLRQRLFEYMTAGQFAYQEMLSCMKKEHSARLPIFHTCVVNEYKDFIKNKRPEELKDIEATVIEALLRKMQTAGRSDIWHIMSYEEDRCRCLDERSQYVRPCIDELFPIGAGEYVDYRSVELTEAHQLIPEHIAELKYVYEDENHVDKRYWRIASESMDLKLGIYHAIVLEQPDFIAFAIRTPGGLEWSKPSRPGIQVTSSVGILAGIKCGCKILVGDGIAFKESADPCRPFMEKYYQLKVEEDIKKAKGQPFNTSKRSLGKAIILIPTGKMAQRDHEGGMELVLGLDRAEKRAEQLRERHGTANVKEIEEFGNDMYVVSYTKSGFKGSGKPHLYTNLIYEWARFGLILKVLMHIPYSELLCMETDGVIFTETGYRAAMEHKEFRDAIADTPQLRPGVMTDDTTKDIIDAGCKWFIKKRTFWNNVTKTWWNGDDTHKDTYCDCPPGSIWCVDTCTYWSNGLDTHMRAPCWIGCAKKCYALYALNVITGERETLKIRFKGLTTSCDKCKTPDDRRTCKHVTQVLNGEYEGVIMKRLGDRKIDSDLINSMEYHEQTELFRDNVLMEPFCLDHFFQFLARRSLTVITSHIKRASPFSQDHKQWLRNYYTSKTLLINDKKSVEHAPTAVTDMQRLYIGFKCVEQQAQTKLKKNMLKEAKTARMIEACLIKPPPDEWL